MLDLPRSVRLAIWTHAVLDGDADVRDAVRAVQGDDEPHTVTGDVPDLGADLTAALGWLSGRAAEVTVVLPVPGHPVGLPGPGELGAAAMDAGEAVLLDLRQPGGPGAPDAVGLVPEVTAFGSWLEPGTLTEWRAWPTQRPRVVDLASLSEAERALREAMRTATEALADLDVARWRDDAADRIAGIRDGGLDRRLVPGGTPPRALRVLASAARVRAIVDLAAQDDGAAVNGWQAQHRSAALRDVDHVARRAMVAAVNSPA